MAAFNRATVKAVLSGDTIVVMGQATHGPPPEKQLTLSGIMAPRLGRRDGTVKDEPFAWQSREFLRRTLIGKNISFRIDQSVASIGRDFGTVLLDDNNVSFLVAASGWAKVKAAGKDIRTEETEELVRLEASAQNDGLGLWNKDEGASAASIRNILLPEHYTAAEVFEAAGSEPQDAIIDQVVTGSTVRAFLLPRFISITLHLSGIQSPSIKRDGETEVAEPFAREAKFFTETRLLHREVKIVIEGIDKFQNFFGSVRHAAGNISEFLLVNGLARVVEWSIKTNRDKDKLYAAERAAKQNRLRLWKDYVAPVAPIIAGAREFHAKIVEVVSGDCVVVKDPASDNPLAVKRLALASIRAPRPGNAKAGSSDEPCAAEAKEYLRSRFIGKKVKVTIDYVRPIPVGGDKTEDRAFASLESDKGNISEALVAAGLAAVVRHRGDEPRSMVYDQLLQLEAEAQKQGKGMHSKSHPPVRHVNDVSTPAQSAAAKQYFPSLQRSGRVRGIVEFVANGGRLKVYIPKESCIIALGLSGLKCPMTARRDKEGDLGEPYGEAAYAFTKDLILQHDVEIEVEAQDKVGTIIGTVYIGGKNLGVLLLEQGLARLQPGFRPERVADSEALVQAETRAKKQQIGIWTGYVEPTPEESEEKDITPELIAVTCSHVVDGTTVFLQSAGEAKTVLPKIQDDLARLGATAPVTGYHPKNGDLVAAQFSGDDLWYRARVLRRTADAVNVVFVDYGNEDLVPFALLRPLPPSLTTTPPLAKECQLAFLKGPKEEEQSEDAYQYTGLALTDKELTAKIEFKDVRTNRLHVTITEVGETSSHNSNILREGLARISRPKRSREAIDQIIAKFAADEDFARRGRINIWRYGDCIDSDDDEPRGPAPAARR